MEKYSVIYDACVLYPAPLRDLLMYLAITNLFKARWSDEIHDEDQWGQSRLILPDIPGFPYRSSVVNMHTLMQCLSFPPL